MPAFWDGGHKMIIRFAPTEAGQWIYKITSNLKRSTASKACSTPPPSDSPGYVNVANVHHWATDNKQPHLWMGYIADRFAFESPQEFEQQLNEAAQNKFTHFRGSILGSASDASRVCLGQDQPNPAYFDELDRRVLEIHKRGITTDLMLASDPDVITSLFPGLAIARALHSLRGGALRSASTSPGRAWRSSKTSGDGRALLKELGLDLKKLDPYQHPRSTNAKITSSPLLADGWMNFIIEGSQDDARRLHRAPVLSPFLSSASPTPQHLWNATMDGEYPEFRGPNPAVASYLVRVHGRTRGIGSWSRTSMSTARAGWRWMMSSM